MNDISLFGQDKTMCKCSSHICLLQSGKWTDRHVILQTLYDLHNFYMDMTIVALPICIFKGDNERILCLCQN